MRTWNVKKLFCSVFMLFSASLCFAGDSNYEDMPTLVDEEVNRLMQQYETQSRGTLPYFDEQFDSEGERGFYVVTRLYEGDLFEQIFVEVSEIQGGNYIGFIANDSMGVVEFVRGDPIEVNSDDVVDWLIVNSDGTEEGNLQGKAVDLYRVGKAAFISKMIPQNGKFTSFEVVSVVNPYTKQEITDIVPEAVSAEVVEYLLKTIGGAASEDGKEKYTYTVVRFPGWEIVETAERQQ